MNSLDADSLGDAEFRAKDLAWAAIVSAYDQGGHTPQEIGQQIGRHPAWVLRHLSSSVYMTMEVFGLLAEAMNCDIEISVRPR